MDAPRKPGYWESLTQKTQQAQPQAQAAPAPEVPVIKQRRTYALVLRTLRGIVVGMGVLGLLCLWLNATGLLTGILLGDMALIPPNRDDRLNADLARARKETDYCELISAQAAVVHLLAPQGRQAAFSQSECYFDLAVMLRDDLACASVRPLITAWWDGSEISPAQCAAQVYASIGRAPGGGGSHGRGAPLAAGSPLSTPVAQAMPSAAPLGGARTGGVNGAYAGETEEAGRPDDEAQQQHQDDQQEKFQDAWENWKRSRGVGTR